MDFLNKLGDTIACTSKDVTKKTKEIADTAKINCDIKILDAKIATVLFELGKAYYEDHKGEDDLDYSAFIDRVEEYKQQIQLNTEKLLEIKRLRICPSCGGTVEKQNLFCTSCGTKIDIDSDDDETAKFCINCGHNFSYTGTYCPICGLKLI